MKQNELTAASTVALVTGDEAFCTGTLIDPRFILTASHCLKDMSTGGVHVYFGLTAKGDAINDKRLVRSESLLMHENYILESVEVDPDTGYAKEVVNDIALLELAKEAPKDAVIVPLVKNGTKVAKGSDIVLAGFGQTNPNSDVGVLRQVETKFGGELGNKEVEIARGNKNSCAGDSGGPLYIEKNGHLEVLGVLSRGDEACVLTGIYTDVREFGDWLSHSMDKLREDKPVAAAPSMNVPFPAPSTH